MMNRLTDGAAPSRERVAGLEGLASPGRNRLELATGQLVIVVARWVLVLAGLLIALWHPDPLPQLRVEIGVILAVAVANFVMHAQLLRHRQTLAAERSLLQSLDERRARAALLEARRRAADAEAFVDF